MRLRCENCLLINHWGSGFYVSWAEDSTEVHHVIKSLISVDSSSYYILDQDSDHQCFIKYHVYLAFRVFFLGHIMLLILGSVYFLSRDEETSERILGFFFYLKKTEIHFKIILKYIYSCVFFFVFLINIFLSILYLSLLSTTLTRHTTLIIR